MKKSGKHNLAQDWSDGGAMGSTARRKVPTGYKTDKPKARSSSGRPKTPTGGAASKRRVR